MRFRGFVTSGVAVTRQNEQTDTRNKQKRKQPKKKTEKKEKKRSIPYQLKNIYPGNKKKL